jgi:hypothetical protein
MKRGGSPTACVVGDGNGGAWSSLIWGGLAKVAGQAAPQFDEVALGWLRRLLQLIKRRVGGGGRRWWVRCLISWVTCDQPPGWVAMRPTSVRLSGQELPCAIQSAS